MVNIHEIHALINVLTNDLITKSCRKYIVVADYLASFDRSFVLDLLEAFPSDSFLIFLIVPFLFPFLILS